MAINKKDKIITTEKLEAEFGPLTFSNALKSERLCSKMTQTQAAKILGISKRQLSDLETGRCFPCLEFAKMAAEKFSDNPRQWQRFLKRDIERAAKKKQNIAMPASQVLWMFQTHSRKKTA